MQIDPSGSFSCTKSEPSRTLGVIKGALRSELNLELVVLNLTDQTGFFERPTQLFEVDGKESSNTNILSQRLTLESRFADCVFGTSSPTCATGTLYHMFLPSWYPLAKLIVDFDILAHRFGPGLLVVYVYIRMFLSRQIVLAALTTHRCRVHRFMALIKGTLLQFVLSTISLGTKTGCITKVSYGGMPYVFFPCISLPLPMTRP